MVGDPREDIAQPGFRIEVVEPCRLNQGIHRGGADAAGVGAGEEVVLPAQSQSLMARSAALVLMSRRPSVV